MAQGSTIIRAKPSDADSLSTREIAAELREAAERIQEGNFKYCYNYGFRKIGDPLTYFGHDSKQWTYPQDIDLEVKFNAAEGQCVSYVEIKTDQGSSLRKAEIVEGGIGEEHIRILIRAQNTYWWRYEVRIYTSIHHENNVG